MEKKTLKTVPTEASSNPRIPAVFTEYSPQNGPTKSPDFAFMCANNLIWAMKLSFFAEFQWNFSGVERFLFDDSCLSSQ